ncbi:alpha-1,6-mannosyltransferase Och1 [Neophaeococcomyces mojaviensis]|uniref:Alpha-1,6-mannosyltransferase Och1 n=1 Tax=Neophaeococcomyces mojaviensis TaxID=3383035 RepID=A0ACC3A8S7_9EURO|nr:alpha-1,6-mannosyltransferase Och1 [Knufia sp. JES_112]
MWASRKAIVAALVLVTLFFLLRHTSSPSTSVRTAGTTGTSPSDQKSPSESHPPPPQTPPKANPIQQIVNDISSKPLRTRLAYYFPYEIEGKFPGYVWQTWKVGPASGAFEDHLRPLEASWTEKHPGFVHEVITDQAAEPLIRYLFASVPEVAEAYSAMPLPVLKADFFRYLILLARGGIYTDIDTEALKSAAEWLPERLDHSSVGLVIGIEADPDRPDWAEWYARRIQFCQWTIQAKAGHPILREIVAAITEKTLELKRQGLLKHGRTPTSISVMEYTGPGIWTDIVFNYFNNHEYFEFDAKYQNITVQDFFNIQEHKKVGDVVVLPITSFSPGVGQMNAGEPDHPMAFVRHDFEGSWKPEKEQTH